MILPSSFFNRPAPEVARALLGQTLVRRLPDGRQRASVITETEAYEGFEDRASHAHRGRTDRNAVMFGPPGRIYLYLCYGMHWMLNLVTREAGYPSAVLLRGTTDASGPGRLTRHFGLDGELNGLPLRPASGLWIRSARAGPDACRIRTAPRVGVDYAGPEWKSVPWRFILEPL